MANGQVVEACAATDAPAATAGAAGRAATGAVSASVVRTARGSRRARERGTALAQANPLAKLVCAVGICAAAFASDNLVFLVGLLALDVALGFAAGVPGKAFKLLAAIAGACALLFVLQVLFVRTGDPVVLFVTTDGVRTASFVALRLIDATMPLAIMLMVTRPGDMAGALVKRVGLPYKYAFTVTTAMRFVPVFASQMSAIMEAQRARGVEFDTRNPAKKLQLMLPLAVSLLVTSVGKTDQAAMAAEVRGFYLRDRASGVKPYAFSAGDVALMAAAVALVVAAVLL